MADKTISLKCPSTLYDDAVSQLSKYGKTINDKILELIQDLAYEFRFNEAEKQVNIDIESRIFKTDFVK